MVGRALATSRVRLYAQIDGARGAMNAMIQRPMKTAPRAFAIEQLDLPSAPEPLVAEVAALRNALQREYLPDDPPVPAAAIAARARARPKMFRMREWLARDAARWYSTANASPAC